MTIWTALPKILLALILLTILGFVSGRLLGVRLSWKQRFVAAFFGSFTGAVLTGILWYQNRGMDYHIVGVVFILLNTLVILAMMEMLGRPGRLISMESRLISIPRPFRAIRNQVARSRRYGQITWIAARHGLGNYLRPRPKADAALSTTTSSDRLALGLRNALQEAGGVFIKLGQVLSTRPDLLPPQMIARLADLQDRVPSTPWPVVEIQLKTIFKAPLATLFAKYDTEPLAAASIAQVYRAWLPSGQPVVIKVQRPGIRSAVERDLDIMLHLAQTIEARLSWGKSFQTVKLAQGFANALLEELDFQVEARNTKAARFKVKSAPLIYIPQVYTDLSSSQILVLEWLDGVNIRNAEALSTDSDVDFYVLAQQLLYHMLHQLMVQGIFHADPHPGNVMLLRDGRLALIDWGSVGRLGPLQQAALRNLLLHIQHRDAAGLCSALLDISEHPEDLNEDRLERALAQFIAQRLSQGMPISAALFTDMFRLLLDYGLAFPPEIGGVFRAFVTLEGTLRVLHPDFNMIDEANKYALTLIKETVTPASVQQKVQDELLSLLPLLHRFPRHLDRISSALENGSLTTNVRLFADERDRAFITALCGRILLAFLGVAIGIISVLLLNYHGGPTLTASLSLFEFLSYFGLFGSTILILRVIFAVLRPN